MARKNKFVQQETLEDVIQEQTAEAVENGEDGGNLNSALTEAREKARSAETRAAELERRLAEAERAGIERQTRLEERLNLINERLQSTGQEQEQIHIPDIMDDPLTHFKLKTDQLNSQNQFLMQKLAQLEQVQQARQQQEEVGQQIRGVLTSVDAQQKQYAQEHPDYYEATQHLRQSLDQQLEAAGYRHPVQRAQMIQQQFNALIANSLQQGRNPAEAAYLWAKQAGYGGKDKFDNIQANQRYGSSMNSTPGRSPKQLSIEAIANMDQDQFDNLINDDRRFKALFN